MVLSSPSQERDQIECRDNACGTLSHITKKSVHSRGQYTTKARQITVGSEAVTETRRIWGIRKDMEDQILGGEAIDEAGKARNFAGCGIFVDHPFGGNVGDRAGGIAQ